MKILLLSLILFVSFTYTHCHLPVSYEADFVSFEEIQMECMDIVSIGGELEVVVNTKQEYENLIYQRFKKPLEHYWNTYYDSILQSVKTRYPGLFDYEYERLVREVFYSVPPFKGTENCIQPNIDFSKFTLLGKDAHSGGCGIPEYIITVEKNKKRREYIFRILIKSFGDCEMAFNKNIWILMPKMTPNYAVKFERVELK